MVVIPVVATPDRTSKLRATSFQKGVTICAGTFTLRCSNYATPLALVAPHLRSLTAAENLGCLQIFVRQNERFASYIFKDRLDWSTVMPMPIVVDRDIFCRYCPLDDAGLALMRSDKSACRLPFSASASKLALPIVQ